MNAGGEGLRPYGLQSPARLIFPRTHKRPGYHARQVKIGDGVDTATLTITAWDACPPGCPDRCIAGRSITMKVPCDAMPHCGSCECGDGHVLGVSEDQARELLAAL